MKTLGWPLIIFLTVIPVLLWSLMMPLTYRFANLATTTTSIGQLSALIGMTLFSLSMILSIRLKLFDTLFGGLNRAYIVHHQVGGTGFLLLMLHPIGLVVSYLMSSMKVAALFLLPGDNWVNNFGIAGLLSLMGLLIFTYYIDLPYELWRFTHKFMGVAFLFGAIHTFFVPSDVSLYIPLKIYLFTLISIGIICYIYKTVLGRWLVHKIRYTVFEIEPKKDGILDIILTPEGEEILDFSPGQFVFIEFNLPGVLGQSHPFSISSAPSEKGFALTIKALGDFTNELSKIPKGTNALVEGPFGRFSPVFRRSQSYIWVAGGIGITPFLSMARSLLTSKPVDLYYVVRTEDEAIFLPELHEIAKRIPTLRVIPWFTKQYGHLTSDSFIKYSPQLFHSNVFVCGPPAMMKSTKKELRKAGVKSAHIHSEEFNMN